MMKILGSVFFGVILLWGGCVCQADGSGAGLGVAVDSAVAVLPLPSMPSSTRSSAGEA